MEVRQLVIAAYFWASTAYGAEVLIGEVVGITDGDTLTILVDREPVKVRLAEIDSPERKQPYYTRSRQSLAAICHRKPAQVTWKTRDRYKRRSVCRYRRQCLSGECRHGLGIRPLFNARIPLI